jgi:hypothetical protein
VEFLEDADHTLVALGVTAPATSARLAGLHAALLRVGVQVAHVRLKKQLQTVSYVLSLAELDGSKISSRRRLATQAAVLEQVLHQPNTTADVEVIAEAIAGEAEQPPYKGWRFRSAAGNTAPAPRAELACRFGLSRARVTHVLRPTSRQG